MTNLSPQELNRICRYHRSGGFWFGVLTTISGVISTGLIAALIWWLMR